MRRIRELPIAARSAIRTVALRREQEMLSALAAGYSVEEVAQEFNMHPEEVREFRERKLEE